jgi:hypothetical protein
MSITIPSYILAIFIMSGCVSTIESSNQNIKIETYVTRVKFETPLKSPTIYDQPIDSAKCVVWNDNEKWTMTTPGVVNVPRSPEKLRIECNGASSPTPSFALGCGWLIPRKNEGATYSYPSWIRVALDGQCGSMFDAEDEKKNQPVKRGIVLP